MRGSERGGEGGKEDKGGETRLMRSAGAGGASAVEPVEGVPITKVTK